jgi:hypothetical protein
MKRAIGMLMVSRSSNLDPDAQAFLAAAGITDVTITNAINTLVKSAKTNGWWTLCNAIYPFVGGTSTTCKFNLKDPRDLDAAFRLTFSGTPAFAANGVTWNNTDSFGDTHLVPNTTISQNDAHLSIYCRSATPPASFGGSAIGGNNSSTFYYEIGWDSGGTPARLFYGLNSIPDDGIANQARNGQTLVTRSLSNDVKVYFNGSQVANPATVSGGRSALSIYLGAYHQDPSGTANGFDNGQYAFTTIGANISSGIQGLMYTDIQTFQTALSRQV